MNHRLKVSTSLFNQIESSLERITDSTGDLKEVRMLDTITFEEYNFTEKEYTGFEIKRLVSYTLKGAKYGIPEPLRIIGLKC